MKLGINSIQIALIALTITNTKSYAIKRDEDPSIKEGIDLFLLLLIFFPFFFFKYKYIIRK